MERQTARTTSARHLGQGAIALCAVLWSTSGLCIKLVNWHPILIAGARSAVAVLVFISVRILFPQKNRIKGNRFYVIAGGFTYAGTMILFVIANKLTASANAILLEYTAPVWAALLGWCMLREKPHWEHWGALVMVAAGMLLFFREGLKGGSVFGDSLALLSGILFGANSVIMRKQKDANPSDSMFLAHIITAAFSLPFFFIYTPKPDVPNLVSLLFMGVFQIGAASLLFAYGIKRVTAVQSMLTAMFEPVLNPVWVFLVMGEKPALSALFGGGIIVAAVIVSSVIGKRRELMNSSLAD